MKPLPNQNGESCDAVLTALKRNKSVKDVYLGPYFYASLSDQSRSNFIQRLGHDLRHLRSLSIGTLEYTRACIEGDSIGMCIAEAIQLHTIRVERDITLSSAKETILLSRSIRRHPSLRRVSLLSLNPTSIDTAALDPVLLALSSLSSLESLQLGVSEDCTMETQLDPSTVATLAQNCRNLSWLYMSRFPLEDDHMLALFNSIGAERDALGGAGEHVEDEDIAVSEGVVGDEVAPTTRRPRLGRRRTAELAEVDRPDVHKFVYD